MKKLNAVIIMVAIIAVFLAFSGGYYLSNRVSDGGYVILTERGTAFAVQTLTDTPAEREFVVVNINTADIEQLTTLPGIGEVRAAALIEYREANGGFTSPEDILEV